MKCVAMRISVLLLACFVCSLVTVPLALPLPAEAPTAEEPGEIAYHEAEILIYLLPVAKEVRARGTDITWERVTDSELNQDEYFVFWVMDTRPNPYGSSTIGYYAVNKHTADVWDFTEKELITSTELERVETILREAHHIDQRTVQEYRSRPISLGEAGRVKNR